MTSEPSPAIKGSAQMVMMSVGLSRVLNPFAALELRAATVAAKRAVR